jgi:Protein of unknown function (DUF2934)
MSEVVKKTKAPAKPRSAAKTKAAVEEAAAPAKLEAVKPKAKPAEEQVTSASPTREQIAELAHRFWAERGRQHGSHEQDWLRAEHELKGKAS